MFTFDRFEVGASYGEHILFVSEQEVETWHRLFGGERSTYMPVGMTSVIAMRAYLALISPRPPGNIHGGSSFVLQRRIRVGDSVVTRVGCSSKAIRRGRRVVEIAVRGTSSEGVAFDATITSLVAR